jgi:hypothetical protein
MSMFVERRVDSVFLRNFGVCLLLVTQERSFDVGSVEVRRKISVARNRCIPV